MPATALVLPPQQVPVIDTGGLVSLPWRSSLQNALNNLQAQITALAALEGDTTALETALAALQAEVDAAEASIAAHIADTANPHATTAAQVGADPAGTATAAVAAHVALADPHTQYLTEAAATAGYQPLDATLTALSGANWALNALPIGTGPDSVSQVAFAANTFPARASTGNLVAKTITDGALSALAGSGGTAGWLRGDGTVSGALVGVLSVDTSGNPGVAGTTSVLISGDGNKERIEARSFANGDPTFQGKQAGGTLVTPTATSIFETLVQLGGSGHDGTAFVVANRGIFRVISTETWTSTAQGAALQFITASAGTVINTTRWTLNESGFIPFADNAYTVGNGTFRVSEYFGAIGAINTSDAREKTPVRPFTDAELAAALDMADQVGFFQFLASVERKGDDAREHCGLTVQGAIEAMRKHGLDPFRYGFICHDRWDEQPEIVRVRPSEGTEEPEVLQEYHPAGDRYSFRPDQLDRFIAKGIRENQKRIEARLAVLEGAK